MIKVSVVSTKDIWKYIIKIGVIVAALFIILKIYNYSKKNFETKTINTTQCISYITEEITEMGELKKPNIFEIKPQSMLESEFRMSTTVSSRNITSVDEEDENQDNVGNINTTNNIDDSVNQENIDTSNITEVSTDIQTETVASKYKNTYNYEKNGIKIKNETSYDLANMNLSTNITVNSKNILIFHTHTCESYTQTDANKYESTGNYRTTDLNHNVVRVGDELQKYLTSYGYNVIHNKTFHDYPAYTGSYGRSLKTVSGILSQNKDTDVVIDLHRDAIGDDSYAPKVKIGDEYAAQIMFVIGTNGSGLAHDNWQQNLQFAMKVQQKANELYPGLFKPILLRNARYNQHLSKAANIIEIGATGNTLEECETSAKYLAKVLDEVL
jgi:stage II sporulation protein P